MSFPPRFTHGSMGCRTCFLPIFSEAAFFLEFFFSLCTSPSRELKSSGMESPAPKIPKNNVFFYCGSGNTPFVACVVTVAWGFMIGLSITAGVFTPCACIVLFYLSGSRFAPWGTFGKFLQDSAPPAPLVRRRQPGQIPSMKKAIETISSTEYTYNNAVFSTQI